LKNSEPVRKFSDPFNFKFPDIIILTIAQNEN